MTPQYDLNDTSMRPSSPLLTQPALVSLPSSVLSHPTDTHPPREDEIVEAFGLDRVVKSSAVFDMGKLKVCGGGGGREGQGAAGEVTGGLVVMD